MGAYLDRLNAQYDEIRQGIDALVNRAAEENRDVTDPEQQQVDRDQSRLSDLEQAIKHYTDLETSASQVQDLRAKVRPTPVLRSSGPDKGEPEYQLTDDFATAGEYAVTLHRAMVLKDPAAVEKIERATAHQLLADNPGLVPKGVLGPVYNQLNSSRPFIQSCVTRPLPAGKFDRPYIDQHVAVGKQAAEKTLTDSQKMTVLSHAVQAATYAGHLNISRQDIKWTSPGILQLVFDDFAAVYAVTTCADACAQFVASVASAAVPIGAATPAGIAEALYGAQAASLSQGEALADTMYVSPDVWGKLGSMPAGANGGSAYPSLSVGSTNGNPLGMSMVVDHHFPADTFIVGPRVLNEWYEDVDGLIQVGEPDVLGQLVGYAGYGAYLNVDPGSFTKFGPVPALP